MQIYDEDSVNTLVAEDRAYRNWEREEKNKIFHMVSEQRKQEAWNKLFPQVEHSEGWELSVNVF